LIKSTIGTILTVVVGIFAFCAISFGSVWFYYNVIEPTYINQHAINVRHSVDYVMAQNQQAQDLITQWNSANSQYQHDKANNEPQSVIDGDLAHMNSLRNDIQRLANNLSPDEVAPAVQQFLYDHPGPVIP
jgi:hypothetical protein